MSLRQMVRGAGRILPPLWKHLKAQNPSCEWHQAYRQQPPRGSSLPTNTHWWIEKLDSEAPGILMGEVRPRSGAWKRLHARLLYQTVTVSSCVICGLDRFTDWSPVTGGKWREWISRDFSGGSSRNEGGEGRQQGGEWQRQSHAEKWKNNTSEEIIRLQKKEERYKQGCRKGAKGGKRGKQDASKKNGEKWTEIYEKKERTFWEILPDPTMLFVPICSKYLQFHSRFLFLSCN